MWPRWKGARRICILSCKDVLQVVSRIKFRDLRHRKVERGVECTQMFFETGKEGEAQFCRRQRRQGKSWTWGLEVKYSIAETLLSAN